MQFYFRVATWTLAAQSTCALGQFSMPKLRLSLSRNFGAGKGTVASIVLCEPIHEEIAKVSGTRMGSMHTLSPCTH